MPAPLSDDRIAQAIRDLAHRRGQDASFCPSEVARALASDWRPLMPRIRAVAAGLTGIEATQKGHPVDPDSARGPVRLRLARGRPEPCAKPAAPGDEGRPLD